MSRLGRHTGSHDIEPSCGVLEELTGGVIENRFVIDCGTGLRRTGGQTVTVTPDLSKFQDGRPIDAVLLTHAHYDHMGSLPALVPFLSRHAGIYMTKATAAALRLLWRAELDSTRQIGGPKPYTKAQLREAMRRIKEIGRSGSHHLQPGLDVWVQPAGHISGACSYTIRIGRHLVHYSGDRCDHDQPGVLGGLPPPDSWRPNVVAGSDCTYGLDAVQSSDWRAEMDRAVETCRQALLQDRRVLLYAFALHRSGVIAHELQRQGVTDIGPVCIDGSAGPCADLFTHKGNFWCDRDRPFVIDEVGLISDHRERRAVRDSPGGLVIIAPPGMGGPGGTGTWWRRDILPDPDAVVAFTGYVAADTDGAIVLRADAERRRTGQVQRVVFEETDRHGQVRSVSLPLRCQVEQFRLGGHNDHQRTIQWFRDVAPEVAVLSHGSVAALAQVEAELSGSGLRLVRADIHPEVELDV